MTGTTVQEINVRIQQLSLSDQLWLLEKLAQHIRDKVKEPSEQLDENAEKYINGSSSPSRSEPALQTTEEIEQDDELAAQEAGSFYLEPGSPLYEDMKQILEGKAQDRLKFYSYEEVFGE